MVSQKQINHIFAIIYTVILTILVVGTPLVFTSLTRSVFEVNKLLLLRYSTLITVFIWCLHYFLLRDNHLLDSPPSSLPESNQDSNHHSGFFNKLWGITPPNKNIFSLFGSYWQKIGLEKIVLIWLIFNVISTIFSQNIRISIIGAYDRWEGIITLFNYMILLYMYAKLLYQKFQSHWIIWGIFISTALSAYYGILQSLGHDFMNWSADPTFRVFACINNPVHFCAYVGMVVPLGIGLTLFLLSTPESFVKKLSNNAITLIKTGVIIIGTLIYYSVLSPSLFSINFIQFILLLGIGITITESLNKTHLSWQDIVKWIGFMVLLVLLNAFNLLTLLKTEWAGLITLLSFYVIIAPLPYGKEVLKRFVFVGTGLIFYAMYLSFSRATWIGYLLSMPFFYLVSTHCFNEHSKSGFIKSFFYTMGVITTHCLLFNFKIYAINNTLAVLFSLLFILFFSLLFKNEHQKISKSIVFPSFLILSFAILFFEFSFTVPLLIKYTLLLASTLWVLKTYHHSPKIYQVVLLMMFFAHLQFVSQSLFNITAHLFLIISYGYILFKTKQVSNHTILWLCAYLLLMGAAIMLPHTSILISALKSDLITTSYLGVIAYSILICSAIYFLSIKLFPHYIIQRHAFRTLLTTIVVLLLLFIPASKFLLHQNERLLDTDQNNLKILDNVSSRVRKLDTQLKSSARISMWKSAIPWTMDHWLIGTGPDTIKYMYPVYRRSEYGILEGGHNFTPDRLHNEYLNTLATRGITGFIIYYFGIILGWIVIILHRGYDLKNSPYFYFIFAAFTGVNVYLGQVIFNFGVVATLVLFYILMGLAWAISTHTSYRSSNV